MSMSKKEAIKEAKARGVTWADREFRRLQKLANSDRGVYGWREENYPTDASRMVRALADLFEETNTFKGVSLERAKRHGSLFTEEERRATDFLTEPYQGAAMDRWTELWGKGSSSRRENPRSVLRLGRQEKIEALLADMEDWDLESLLEWAIGTRRDMLNSLPQRMLDDEYSILMETLFP